MAVFDIENIVYALKGRREEIRMSYKHEWVLIEATDDIDEMEHREPTEEFLFYRAVATGDIDKVKQNCEQERFMSDKGVGILCNHDRHDYQNVQGTRNGTGTGFSPERFLYSEVG